MLDDAHLSVTTARTGPQGDPREGFVSVAIVWSWPRRGRAWLGHLRAKDLPAVGEVFFAVAISEQAVVANAVESCRQDVEEEAPDEFAGG